jgi:hypothetical protein
MAEEVVPEVAEVDTEKAAHTRAEQLFAQIKDGKLVAEIFGQALEKQYTIYGKSMSEWRRHFHITIAEDPDPASCSKSAARLANLFHEATFYFSVAEAQLDALSNGETREYTTAFNKICAEYKEKNKSLPAQKTLDTMASSKMLDLKGAINNARIAKNFMRRTLDGLTEQRKALEIISRNNFTQTYLSPRGSGNIPEAMPNRGTFGDTTGPEEDNEPSPY